MNLRPFLPLAPFALSLFVAGCGGGAVQTSLPAADAALTAV